MFSDFMRRAAVPRVSTMLYLHKQFKNDTPIYAYLNKEKQHIINANWFKEIDDKIWR